ncbi:hypothetical protein E4T47_02511 [Aureobasidium subglaciale]|nr:hypothetical protein E4T47_02511 [Aureobasidium subglaciale]
MFMDQAEFARANKSTQAALLVPAIIILALSLLLYGVRVRARRSAPLLWTDGMITAALMLAIVDFILIAISCHYGLGRHTGSVNSVSIVKARYLSFLAQPICIWSVCLAKCSIAWTALSKRQDRQWQWIFCWIIFVQIACTTATNVIQVVQCQPTPVLWDDNVLGQCWPPQGTQLAAYVTLSFGIITSILLSLTPIAFVKAANRPLHELIALGLLVGLGLFISMSSVVNMIYLHTYRMSDDPLRDMVAPTIWWQIEQNLSIIAALAVRLRTPYETLLARCGLICQVRTNSSACHRLNRLEDGSQMLKSFKTTIQWGSAYDSTAHLPSIVKTTEVVHSTELVKDNGLQFGSPARRPSWQ